MADLTYEMNGDPLLDSFQPLPTENDILSLFLNDEYGNGNGNTSPPSSVPNTSPGSSPPPYQDDLNSSFLDMPESSVDLGSGSFMNSSPFSLELSSESDEAGEVPSNNSSNRKRNFTELQGSVTLSPEELKNMSSKGLEEYAQSIAATRPLTASEERQLKRQRRLIKNRESAQLSRMRKKMYIEELERKYNTVSVHSEHMAAQMAHLAAENKALKNEVSMLRNALRQQRNGTPITLNEGKVAGITGKKPVASRNAQAAGICLFIVLFSFGLFFNAGTGAPVLPKIARDAVPEVVPTDVQRYYTGRVLQSIENDVSEKSKLHRLQLQDLYDDAEEEALQVPQVVEVPSSVAVTAASASSPKKESSWMAVDTESPSDMVVCAEAKRWPAQSPAGVTQDGLPAFSLLLPPSALQGTVPNVEKLPVESLLEVGCQILSINVIPSYDHINTVATVDVNQRKLSQPVASM